MVMIIATTKDMITHTRKLNMAIVIVMITVMVPVAATLITISALKQS